jgi:hypothetical protein
VPVDKISRVTSYDDFGAYVAIPIGQLSAIPIAMAVGGYARLAVVGGFVYFALATLPFLLGAIWQVTSAEQHGKAAALR